MVEELRRVSAAGTQYEYNDCDGDLSENEPKKLDEILESSSVGKQSEVVVRRRLLFVEQNADGTVGGSHKCLLNLVKCLDREAFDCQVVFYENNSMVAEFIRHCRVSILPAPFRLEMHRHPFLRKLFNAVLPFEGSNQVYPVPEKD